MKRALVLVALVAGCRTPPPPSLPVAATVAHMTNPDSIALDANDDMGNPSTHYLLAPTPMPPQAELHERLGRCGVVHTEHGLASYYADSLAGRPTARGEPYDPRAFTAAHRTLPFGMLVRVTRPNGRFVYVRINDRGPFGHARRIIDLSRAAAEALDLLQAGVAEVRVETLLPQE